ncbi:MAG: c-type cytochrome [Bryobacteraceae bacterium]|nr:c-type cytochrome [Bryobacteraceae bacterium]
MIWLALLALQLPPSVEQGSKLFAKSCATGYCHGAEGAAARGPRLKDRQFERAYLARVTREGIPRSAMPAWKDRFSPAEIEAVVDYIVHLNGGQLGAPTRSEAAPAAAPGLKLFQTKCAGCHRAKSVGLAGGASLAKGQMVRQLTLKDGETFPAYLVSEGQGLTVVLDLTEAAPIRRSLETAEIVSRGPAKWQHSAVDPADSAQIQAWLMLP